MFVTSDLIVFFVYKNEAVSRYVMQVCPISCKKLYKFFR
jgi:hypothetical protein